MKNPWIIFGVVIALLLAGAFYLAHQKDQINNQDINLTTQIKGNPEATVLLEEFSDFQCPACRSAYPFVNELVAQHGDNLRFEYRHFPLPSHPYALQAAMAVEAAGQQGKFYEFHDLVFENQAEWSSSPTPAILFASYAEQLGLDMEKFNRHANASAIRDHVRADFTAGRERGVTGTPTFFLNGERLADAQGRGLSMADIAARVALAIDPASATTASGTTPTAEPLINFGI